MDGFKINTIRQEQLTLSEFLVYHRLPSDPVKTDRRFQCSLHLKASAKVSLSQTEIIKQMFEKGKIGASQRGRESPGILKQTE